MRVGFHILASGLALLCGLQPARADTAKVNRPEFAGGSFS